MGLLNEEQKMSFYKNIEKEITSSEFKCHRAYCEVVGSQKR